MSDRHEDDTFLRNVVMHYAAPPMTASQRARFEARLDERLQRRVASARPWLVGIAVAAAAAGLFFSQTGGVTPAADTAVRVAASEPVLESAVTPEEWILAVGSDVIADANAGLPADYVAISSLLLGE